MAKVLLFCPTYQVKGVDQIWPDALDSFNDLQAPEGVEVVRWIGRDNPYKGEYPHRNTLHQFQQARARVLAEGFDALVTFEHDMIVPADGLRKLWEVPADVVYGLYVLRHGARVLNAFERMAESPNIGQSMTIADPSALNAAFRRGWARVSGCGFGFTLMRRAVLERFEFHKTDEHSYAPDWGFATDCQHAKVKQICRFDVECGHIEDTGEILHPRWNGPTVRVKILQPFVVSIYGESVRNRPGEVKEFPAEKAIEFARVGYVTLLDAPPAVKIIARPRSSKKAVKS